MRDCIVFDIDGTLSDPSHRLGLLKKGAYDLFHSKCHLDQPLGATSLTRLLHHRDMPAIVLVTARPETYMHETRGWLALQGVRYELMLMRQKEDFRPGAVIKREMFEKLRDLGYNVLLALEDQDDICEMLRAMYVPVMQVKGHDIPARTYAQPGYTLLYLMVGPVCAGKTWFAERGNFQHSSDTEGIRLSSDDFRIAITGSREDGSADAQVFHTMKATAKAIMSGNIPVIYDATNCRKKDRMDAAYLTPPGSRCKYVVIDRPLEVKLRNRGTVPEEMVRDYHEIFQENLTDILDGDDLDFVDVLDVREKAEEKVA